jgi:sulfur-oxidizing protein SoxY
MHYTFCLHRFDQESLMKFRDAAGNPPIDAARRDALKTGGGMAVLAAAVAAGLIEPQFAFAQEWNKAAFDTRTIADTVKALGGTNPAASKDIQIQLPDIAENGAVVPITITSNIPKTQSISILIEKNPNTLAASFEIPDGTDPFVQTRVKMGQTSLVTAVVKADGKYFSVSKEVKVTLGGCGG